MTSSSFRNACGWCILVALLFGAAWIGRWIARGESPSARISVVDPNALNLLGVAPYAQVAWDVPIRVEPTVPGPLRLVDRSCSCWDVDVKSQPDPQGVHHVSICGYASGSGRTSGEITLAWTCRDSDCDVNFAFEFHAHVAEKFGLAVAPTSIRLPGPPVGPSVRRTLSIHVRARDALRDQPGPLRIADSWAHLAADVVWKRTGAKEFEGRVDVIVDAAALRGPEDPVMRICLAGDPSSAAEVTWIVP